MGNHFSTLKDSYDLIVIGSGPGGQRAAVQAAKLKKTVLVVEKERIGGACLHWGTIPSKTLREASLNPLSTVKDPLRAVMELKNKVIEEEMAVIRTQLLRNHVEFVEGIGTFSSEREIVVKNSSGTSKPIRAEFIVLATGSRPFRPADMDFNGETLFDSDSILGIKTLPTSLAIVGAGVIGCEYASIFAKLGVHVTIYDRRTTILRGIDTEIISTLENQFREGHTSLRLGKELNSIEVNVANQNKTQARVTYDGTPGFHDALLYCMGRSGNIEELDLAKAGIKPGDRGILKVNSHYQTEVPHIYAVGDLIGFPALAASSAEQGRLAAVHAFQAGTGKFPDSFPYGIYTIPEISCAGAQEEELTAKKIPFVVGRANYRELARGKILGDEKGFLKLLVERGSGKILGVHIIGTGATELVHIGQVVMALGASIEFLVSNVFNYPTLAEAYKVAALNAANQLRS